MELSILEQRVLREVLKWPEGVSTRTVAGCFAPMHLIEVDEIIEDLVVKGYVERSGLLTVKPTQKARDDFYKLGDPPLRPIFV